MQNKALSLSEGGKGTSVENWTAGLYTQMDGCARMCCKRGLTQRGWYAVPNIQCILAVIRTSVATMLQEKDNSGSAGAWLPLEKCSREWSLDLH